MKIVKTYTADIVTPSEVLKDQPVTQTLFEFVSGLTDPQAKTIEEMKELLKKIVADVYGAELEDS